MKVQDFQDNVTCGGFDNIFANIYKPQDIESQKSRYMSAVEKFTALYPNRNDIHVYSAPGRTEIGGNHTDHQHGCVIAGAVDLGCVDTKPNNASFRQNFTHPALKSLDRRQPACDFLPCLRKIYARKSAYYLSVNTP